MSCNIYDEPKTVTENSRYSRSPRNQDGEERVVEIYKSTYNGQLVPRQVLHRSQTWFCPNTEWLKLISSGLGLICVIQLFVIAFLTYYCVQESAPETSGLCPKHWTRFQCSCLFVSLEEKTWNQSRADCMQRGADLIVVDSKEKQDFVVKSRTEATQDFWIGMKRRNGVWTWINNNRMGFRSWRVNVNPEHAAEGSAAFMTVDGPWNYVQEEHKGYMCEKEL